VNAVAPRRVQPLRFRTRQQLRALGEALEAVFREWKGDWGLVFPGAERVECTPALPERRTGATYLASRGTEAAAWLIVPSDFSLQLAAVLFGGEPRAGSVSKGVLAACEEDWLARVSVALRVERADPSAVSKEPACHSFWAGWVRADLPLQACVLMNAEAVDMVLRSGGEDIGRGKATRERGLALVTLADALADASIALHVHLEGCEVDVGVLQELQLGDVVRVRHRLEEPATVRSAAGEVLFAGYLARRRGHKAVELAFSQPA
jgi:hypothetical protein